MKSGLFFASIAMVASSAFATTSNCPSGSLSSYLTAGFACQSGSLTFSNFSYQGTAPAAGSVTTAPLATFDDEGFQFSGGWSATSQNSASASESSQVTYTVAHPGSLIDTLSLSFTSSIAGTGIANVSEEFCLGSSSLSNCPHVEQGSISVTNPGPGFSNEVFFSGVPSIAVSDAISVASGYNGTAQIVNFRNNFSSPEPLSFVLLGTGLVGIVLMRRRLDRR